MTVTWRHVAVVLAAGHLIAGAVLIVLDAPASLTDEDEYMPYAFADLVALRNPYTTEHHGERVVTGPGGGDAFTWTTTFPYLPWIALLQVPFIDYRWTALAAYGVLLFFLRDRPVATVAFANPFVMRLAASGFNDFVVLALLAAAVTTRHRVAGWFAAGAKQFALPVLLVYYAWRREWRAAGLAVAFTAVTVLPFVLADPGAFWHAAVARHFVGAEAKLPALGRHVNYALYPLFMLTVFPRRRAQPTPRPVPAPLPRDPTVAVVLPALDEAGAVTDVVAGFRAAGARVVVADNGSTDGTVERARAAGAEVVHAARRGYGAAVRAGTDHLAADAPDIVVVSDCDGTADPADLPRLLAPLRANQADLVLGRRVPDAGALPPHQRVGNAVAALVLFARHGVRVRDVPPLRALRWGTLVSLRLTDATFGLPVETVVNAHASGARVTEVPVAYRTRAAGHSKVAGTVAGSVRAALRMLRVALRAPPTRAPGTVIVFARAPRRGLVKTRLAGAFGADATLRLYEAMLADTLAAARATGARVVLATDGPPTFRAAAYADAVVRQRGERFGERFDNAFADVEAHRVPNEPVLLVGADTPHIAPATLAAALQTATVQPAVIGPATEGGFWGLGFQGPPVPVAEAFESANEAAAVARLCDAAGAPAALLGADFDVDVPRDVAALQLRLETVHAAHAAWQAPATRRVLSAAPFELLERPDADATRDRVFVHTVKP